MSALDRWHTNFNANAGSKRGLIVPKTFHMLVQIQV
jgi:hypothetical protein